MTGHQRALCLDCKKLIRTCPCPPEESAVTFTFCEGCLEERPLPRLVALKVPRHFEERLQGVIERVATRMGYSFEQAEELATATIIGRGIEHLEKFG